MSFRFAKSEKLKSRKIIEKLFSEGKSVPVYPLKLFYIKLEAENAPQFLSGFSVPKKHFKKAVTRNYIKRLIRENYRLNKYLLTQKTNEHFAFMWVYIGKEIPDFKTVNRALIKLIDRFS